MAISQAIRDELSQAGYDPARVVDIPNGVPVPAAPWSRREGWQDAPRAVFVGRLAPEKNLETLVRAWPIVRRTFPQARLTLVGEGPERSRLESLIAALGLSDAIELPGAMADPTAMLRSCDLFVLPSREEGMSIALLEAMALGMPLVATAIPGNRRLVADREHGRLVPPGDVEELARTICEQWGNFDRAIEMGRAARSLVEREYSITAVARRHLELFERLLAARREACG